MAGRVPDRDADDAAEPARLDADDTAERASLDADDAAERARLDADDAAEPTPDADIAHASALAAKAAQALDTAEADAAATAAGPPTVDEVGPAAPAVVVTLPDEVDPRPSPSPHAQRLQALRANARMLSILVLSVILYTCYFASSLILPVVLAGFFAMLLSPLITRVPLRWVPRWMAALLLVAGMLYGIGQLGLFVAVPAGEWARKVPFVLRDVAPKVREMIAPLKEATKAGATLDTITGEDGDDVERVVVRPPRADLLSATPKVLASALAVILLTFAFLVFGDDLLTKLLTLRPTRAHRKLTAEIVQEIQSDLSRYMLTISATSIVLGSATAAWLFYLGVDDPLLWGTLAAILNLTPFLGPMLTAALLLLVGLAEFHTVGTALLPAGGFLVLHGLESQVLTPLVLGRTMKINPLAIILWLLIWGWLWGVIGLLVAVPMLVCLKIVFSKVRGWETWARMLE